MTNKHQDFNAIKNKRTMTCGQNLENNNINNNNNIMNNNNTNNKYSELDIKIISKLLWEEKHILHEHKQGKSFLSVTKSKRFNSFIFKGTGSKNSLKQFMHFNNDFKIAVQIMDKNGYRQFIPFKSWNHCWDSYKHEAFHKRYLYEVILSDKPCKPYLDIEWKTERSYKDKHLDFLNKIKSDLITIFHKRYNININNDNILILTAHNEEKVSFHININCKIGDKTLAYKTNRKKEQNSAWDLYLALMDIDSDYYKDKIDESVYSLDREFRTIYSTKYGSDRPLIIFDNDISRSKEMINNFDDYLITFTDKPHFIDTPEYILPEKKIIAKINKISEIKSNHVKNKSSDKIVERLLELLHNIHPTAYFTNKTSDDNGWRFSYTDRNEPCFSGHQHKNNGFCCYIKEATGEVYSHCHSNKCSKLLKLGLIDRDTTWKGEALKVNMQYLDYKETLNFTDIFDEKKTKF